MTTLTKSAIASFNQEITKNQNMIIYCETALKSDLENWEKKEYQGVIDGCNEEIQWITKHIEFLTTELN
jgi:hypothetical protein